MAEGRDDSGRDQPGRRARPRNGATSGEPEMTYEQARAELAAVVERLETGGATLEESLSLWERGEELAAVCQRWLDGATARLAAAREQRDQG